MPPPLDSSILFSIFFISHQDYFFFFFLLSYSLHFSLMVPEVEKPRVTEIQVRMDCNGCVQKIKKALYGIQGIYDLYIDFPQQKLTIIGWADPEKIVKAIKKTRKMATICSHTEQAQEPPPPTEPTPQEGNTNANEPPPPPPPHEGANPPPPEFTPPPEPAPPSELPKDQPPPENPQPEPQPYPADAGHPAASGPKDVGEVHVIYHHPPNYGYRYSYSHHGHNGYWNKYHHYGQGHPQEGPVPVSPVPPVPPVSVHPQPPPQPPAPQQQQQQPQPQPQPQHQPMYVTHSYNMYRPSPYVTEYAEYVRSPPRPYPHYYTRMDRLSNNYDQDQNQYYYNNGSSSSNGNITSIFSDENPNACRIV